MKTESASPGLRERLLRVIGMELPYVWAQKAGIQKSTFSGILNKGAIPQTSTLIKIASHTNVSVNWLLTGRGPPRVYEEGDHASFVMSIEEVGSPYLIHKGYILVPRLESTVKTGLMLDSENLKEPLAFKADWIKGVMGLDPNQLALVEVKGDSMEPTLQEGNLLLLDLRERDVRNDAIYVIRRDDFLIAKRMQRGFDGTIHIKSDNPVYEKLVVPADTLAGKLQIVGRAVWSGKRL
ncbi:MAG: helix-turn-helix domain-containing protein [Magnetococcus sp. DMHC-6]